MDLKSILVNAVLPLVETVATAQIVSVLESFQQKNPDQLENMLQGLQSSFLLLQPVTERSSNKVDDTIVEIILNAVALTAQKNGIVLQ